MQLDASASEVTNELINTILLHMKKKNWNLTHLSIESGVPYDSLKKYLSRKIDNPHFYNVIKICCALDMNLGELINLNMIPTFADTSYSSYSHTKHLLEYIINLEKSISACSASVKRDYIPLLHPLGTVHSNSMGLDSFLPRILEVSSYRTRYGSKLSCALEITTNAYHPVYLEHDAILIAQDRPPVYGETGVFIHDGELFIRRYLPGKITRLESINGLGSTIELKSLKDWFIFGYVLTVYR